MSINQTRESQLLEIGLAMIILSTQQVSFKWFQSIRWFGRNSYEIYLTHSFVVLFAAVNLYHTSQPTWLIVTEYLFVVFVFRIVGSFNCVVLFRAFESLYQRKKLYSEV